MSIAALTNALSGLKTSQRALGVISDNIANANTEGYVRKIAEPSSVTLDGQGAGVEIGRIKRVVDEYLLRERREEVGELRAVEQLEIYFNEIQDLFGQPGENNSIAALTERLQTAFQNYEINPEDAFRAEQVVNAAEDISRRLNDMHYTLQDLRARADSEIGDDITELNIYLEQIDEFNVDIIRAEAKGQDAGGLRDKRDVALNRIAEIVDISYWENSDGAVNITTGGGKTLLDVDAVTVFHDTPNGLRSDIAFDPDRVVSDPDLGTIRGILVGGTDEQNDITSELRRGSIKGLVDLRDNILPALVSELDELSRELRDGINAVHNLGAAFPPPSALNGQRVFANGVLNTGADTVANTDDDTTTLGSIPANDVLFNGTGVIRISLVQSDPPAQRGDTVGTFNLDLDYLRGLASGVDLSLNGATAPTKVGDAGELTVADVVSAINAQFNNQNLDAAAIFTSGALSITSTNPTVGVIVDAPENLVIGETVGIEATPPGAFPPAIAGGDLTVTHAGGTATFTHVGSATGADVAGVIAELTGGTGFLNATDGSGAVLRLGSSGGNLVFSFEDADGVPSKITNVVDATTSDLFASFTLAAPPASYPATANADLGVVNVNDSFSVIGEDASTLGTVTITDIDLDGNISLQDVARAINDDVNGIPGVTARVQSFVDDAGGAEVFRLAITADDGQTLSFRDVAGLPSGALGLTTVNTVEPSVKFSESNGVANAQVSLSKIDGVVTSSLPQSLTIQSENSGTLFTESFDLTSTTLADIVTAINGAAEAARVAAGDATPDFEARLVNVDGWKIEISVADGSEITMGGDLAETLGFESQEFGFSHYFGLNDFFAYSENFSASSDLQVRAGIEEDPNLLVTADPINSITVEDAATGTEESTAVTSGNNEGIKALAETMIESRTFDAAGDLPEITLTFSEYATRILSNQSLKASLNGDDLIFREDVVGELTFRVQGVSGVNIDEELSNLQLYQSAYTASARVISASQELLDELVNLVR